MNEVQNILDLVLKARTENQQISQQIEMLRETHKAIKKANDERIYNIQNENKRLDDELTEKEDGLQKTMKEIWNQVYDAKTKLLRRIYLCNLKNSLKEIEPPHAPEYGLSTMYAGRFAVVYDAVTVGTKPVNQYEWSVNVEIPQQFRINNAFRHVWSAYQEAFRDYGRSERYFQRDFKSEEEAKAYAERNRANISQNLVSSIKQVEQEVSEANENIDEVFDFRLITDTVLDPQYSGSDKFNIISAEKHCLILGPILSVYERVVKKEQPYAITVMQQGYQLTISGHRFPSEARYIRYAICREFSAVFRAIEADTGQEIPDII